MTHVTPFAKHFDMNKLFEIRWRGRNAISSKYFPFFSMRDRPCRPPSAYTGEFWTICSYNVNHIEILGVIAYESYDLTQLTFFERQSYQFTLRLLAQNGSVYRTYNCYTYQILVLSRYLANVISRKVIIKQLFYQFLVDPTCEIYNSMLLSYYWWTSRYQDSLNNDCSIHNQILFAMAPKQYQAVPRVFKNIIKRFFMNSKS